MNKHSENGDLFIRLFEHFKKAHPQKTAQVAQKETIELWKTHKSEENFEALITEEIAKLTRISQSRKSTLLSFWSKIPSKTDATKNNSASSSSQSAPSSSSITPDSNPSSLPEPESTNANEEKFTSESETASKQKNEAHAQAEVSKSISILKSELQPLYQKKIMHLLTDEDMKLLKAKEKELKEKEIRLKKLKQGQEQQLRHRKRKKEKMESLLESNPELKKKVSSVLGKVGRPRLEVEQPQLLKTIVDIALHGSAADDRRRNETIRSIKTLKELTEELKKEGYNVSKSGLYLRILPRRSNTSEGKRHVVTVPVKLKRAMNDQHSSHIDGKFCTATIRHLEEISANLGPSQVFFLSQDDKARVPIGLTAANKQSPLLMHLEYSVILPDHDWVIAAQHKLIPSVYAGIEITPSCLDYTRAVTYSVPTFIAIRSGKHAKSTAFSHVQDIDTLINLPEFQTMSKIYENGPTKPVFVITVDGGPDENPRYENVIKSGIHHFLNYDLDALYVATNAPGRSAFNRVERRMAPLSRQLAGLILPHDHYGSHLDHNGITVDAKKEKENFEHAGNCLAQIWSDTTIDKHPVKAIYIDPDKSAVNENNLKSKDMTWRAKHVRESQYFLQIVKCSDESCCSTARSDLFKILPQRFLPPPIPLIQDVCLKSPEFPISDTKDQKYSFPSLFVNCNMTTSKLLPRSASTAFKSIPYDLYCPSVQKQLADRICNDCNLYHSAITRLSTHMKEVCPKNKTNQVTTPIARQRPLRIAGQRAREVLALMSKYGSFEWVDEDEIEKTGPTAPPDKSAQAPLISIESHFDSPWEDE